ncbi:MAG: hypothetical protein CL489_14895 [Acidobacteria bacterium]|nr:hypothetical protein [Acidobacteriota bacterium]
MKKCLILGCSFTSGSYGIDDRYSGTEDDWKNQIWQEKLESRVGWYSYVDWLKKYDVTVIATPAQGYATWVQLFKQLDETQRLKRKYDKIIIQETWEPRITFLQDIEVEEFIRSNFVKCREILDNIEHVILSGRNTASMLINPQETADPPAGTLTLLNLHYNALKRLFADIDKLQKNKSDNQMFLDKNLRNFVFGWFGQKIVEWCTNFVQDLCKKHNIKGYVWSMDGPIMSCTHLKRVPEPVNQYGENIKLRDVLIQKELLTFYNNRNDFGHQTEEGNKLIGEYLNEKMSNIRL